MDLARLLIANFPKPYPLFRRNCFSSLCLLYSLYRLRLSYPWYPAKNPPKQVESCLKFRTLLYATWPRAAASITSTTLLLTYCSDVYELGELCTVEPWILLVRLQKNLRNFLFSENVVIGQSSSKCRGFSARSVMLWQKWPLQYFSNFES